MKKVAILQSNYLPWKGYFALLASVDEFIFYDEVQYTRRDWRNRNILKTANGTQWITVPVDVKGKYFQKINEVRIADEKWTKKHWNAFRANYAKSKYYEEVSAQLFSIYNVDKHDYLSALNQKLIRLICNYLNISTTLISSIDLKQSADKNQRLIDICKARHANTYVSGPSAKNYLDPNQFKQEGISLEWFDYDNFPTYNQLWGDFEHKVSVLDVMFNCGEEAAQFFR